MLIVARALILAGVSQAKQEQNQKWADLKPPLIVWVV